MKYIFILVFLCLIKVKGLAQQQQHYTQFMFNKLAFNPAYAGTKSFVCLTAIYRKQWIGLQRAPQTATFNVDGSVWQNRVGLGLSINYDQIGFADRLSLATNYAYIIRFKNESFLSMGLRASVQYAQIRWSEAELLEDADWAIPNQNVSEVLPNFGAGIYFQTKKYYIGFSVPNLFKTQGNFDQAIGTGLTPKFTQHYYLMGGFLFRIAKQVKVHQNLLLRYVVHAPLAVDINLSFVFYEKVLIGMTYRIGSSMSALIQWQISPQFRIAAAYDFDITEIQRYNSGSIEALLSYCFNKDKKGKYNASTERFF